MSVANGKSIGLNMKPMNTVGSGGKKKSQTPSQTFLNISFNYHFKDEKLISQTPSLRPKNSSYVNQS
jgi:hypothetical protein